MPDVHRPAGEGPGMKNDEMSTKSSEEFKIFSEGFTAYQDGDSTCPYEDGDEFTFLIEIRMERKVSWLKGYEAAQEENRPLQ